MNFKDGKHEITGETPEEMMFRFVQELWLRSALDQPKYIECDFEVERISRGTVSGSAKLIALPRVGDEILVEFQTLGSYSGIVTRIVHRAAGVMEAKFNDRRDYQGKRVLPPKCIIYVRSGD